MRLGVALVLGAMIALLVAAACGVPWRSVAVAVLVATALLLGRAPRRSS